MHKHKFIFAAFLLVVGTHLFNQFHGNVFLHQLSKLLILPLLILYYFRASKLGGNAISFMVILALFFSFLGDTLLMYVHITESYFLAGLVAFLLAHVAFIFVYRQFRHADAANALQGVRRVRMAFPIVLAGSGLVIVLYPHLDKLLWPVIIYATVIVWMTLNALFRYGRTNALSFWLVFFGALFFMLSDSMLAINKFMLPFDYAGFFVMFTYITAQYLIVEGLLQHRIDSK